jgi:hypothetical protein
LSDPEKRLVVSIVACIFFGYAAVNCLVFYRRTRQQAADYKNRPLEGLIRSPQYNWTIWFTGVIGAVGFLISSWQLVLGMFAIMRGW